MRPTRDLGQLHADLVERGVLAQDLEQLDLSAVVRARDETPADGADEVRAVRDSVLAVLETLA